MRYYKIYYYCLIIITPAILQFSNESRNTYVIEASIDVPHPHNGKAQPFTPGNPNITLNENAYKVLELEKPYQTKTTGDTSGRGVCIQDIHSPPNIVWERILDYDNYAKMVPEVIESNLYQSSDEKEPSTLDFETIFARMKQGVTSIEYHIQHYYYPDISSLTWTLDYNRKSDVDDYVGLWYVARHPDTIHKKDWTRVYYSEELVAYDWIPEFVKQFLSKKEISTATTWVKREAEAQWKEHRQKYPQLSSEIILQQPQKKHKKKKFKLFSSLWKQVVKPFPIRKKDKDDITTIPSLSIIKNEETCSNATDEENVNEQQDSSRREQIPPPIGITRIALVFLVMFLIVYNIGLCLERLVLVKSAHE